MSTYNVNNLLLVAIDIHSSCLLYSVNRLIEIFLLHCDHFSAITQDLYSDYDYIADPNQKILQHLTRFNFIFIYFMGHL